MNIINIIKNKSVVLLIAITLILIIGSSLTYAYFDMVVLGNDKTSGSFATGITSLTLDATELLSFENVIPGDTKSYTFTVKNTGDNSVNYKIYFDNVINTFSNNSEILYTLKCVSSSGSCTSIDNETIFPKVSDLILEQATIGKNVTHSYTLIIKFIETNKNQSYNAGKKIEFKISVDKLSNLLSDKIINASGGVEKIIKKGNPDFTSTATLDEGMYATTDLDGTTYYFRGAVTNNYVSFAGKTWRIVRINGDGSIRLILDGYADYYDSTSKRTYNYLANYNSSPECVNGSVTTPELAVECGKYGYGDYASGSIANTVNKWYYETFSLDDQIYIKQDGEFCNDTSIRNTTGSYFGSSYRIRNNLGPTYKCSNYSLFNYDVTKKIISPVGILSADDVYFAGGNWAIANSNFYLYKGSYTFTMSPYYYWLTSNQINILSTGPTSITHSYITNSFRIRPVINLLKETIGIGTGTSSDPYVITGTQSNFITKILENEGGLETINSRVNNVYAPATGDEGMYRGIDDDGYTYYYKGDVQDNYVSFAGFTWRIVRINGDGTVRLILNTEADDTTYQYNSHSDCASDGTSDINVSIECVKYGHGDYASTSLSNIVNSWYNNNLIKYESYIKQDGKFCNDYSYSSISSTVLLKFQYGYYHSINATADPGFKCQNKGSNTLGEAKTLLLPIGLITVNEFMYANGGTRFTDSPNNNYIVNSSKAAWTMSPDGIRYIGDYKYPTITIPAIITNVYSLYYRYSYNYSYYKPVINVYGSVKVTGRGTLSDPYIILDI